MAAKRNLQKEAARQRTAALRAQQEAADRKRRLQVAAVTSAVVLLVIAGVVWAAVASKNKPVEVAKGTQMLSADSLRAINSVPASAYDAAGVGDLQAGPKRVKDAPASVQDGKPRIIYVGAEFCPFCAGLRWSVATAMARFGQWQALAESTSMQEPGLAPISTVSFSQRHHGASYQSSLLSFTGYETSTNEIKNGARVKLDELSGEDKAFFEKYDAKPYTESEGAIPFLSIGGKVLQHGGLSDLKAFEGKTTAQIAAALKDPKDPAAKAALTGANVITAAICETTGNKPAEVCSSAAVKAAATKIQNP
ncbi:DUF929 family protein [Arsenicicoccus dermatophilus]|uniref:DUF929 family protein n=1 Tax=Arsenicicoccus dermatophilus TaxID=1076331 RepID=UPI0039171F0F